MLPSEVAALSLWQVHYLYGRLATAWSAFAYPAPDGPAAPPLPPAGPDPFAAGLPPRDDWAADMSRRFGHPPAHWGAIWDRMKADEDRARAPA